MNILSKWQKFKFNCRNYCKTRVWNSKTGLFYGKKPLTWLKILIYFITFYGVLAALFSICMVVFLKTLDPNQPAMLFDLSPIKNNPAANFVPIPVSTDSALIRFDMKNASTYQAYIDGIDSVINSYKNQSSSAISCSDTNRISPDTSCSFDLSTLGPDCTKENGYGYPKGQPCVLFRINRVYGWDPSANDMATLKCKNQQFVTGCDLYGQFADINDTKTLLTAGRVPFSCEGQNPGDADALVNVQFFPFEGYPMFFYPFLNQPNYISPLLMAKFTLFPGQTVMLWCRLWTSTILHDFNDLQGSVKLEMMIDVPKKRFDQEFMKKDFSDILGSNGNPTTQKFTTSQSTTQSTIPASSNTPTTIPSLSTPTSSSTFTVSLSSTPTSSQINTGSSMSSTSTTIYTPSTNAVPSSVSSTLSNNGSSVSSTLSTKNFDSTVVSSTK